MIVLHPTTGSLHAALPSLPSWATGTLVSASRVELLSPNVTGPASDPWPRERIAHELAHAISLQVNRSLGNNPRWLWETVALYEARQTVDPSTLTLFTSADALTFARLNGLTDSPVYSVGFLLGEFIVGAWSQAAFIDLVRSGGNVQATLGVGEAEFLSRFVTFVRTRYRL